jgi:hypothetical protein
MTDATFDGANLYITLPSIGTFDTQTEIYSAWKEWVALGDNAKYPPAFDTTGGDSVGGGQQIAPYFFCRNDLGWRVKMPTANGEIVISGNLFPRDSSIDLFESTSGFDAFVRLEVSTRAVVVETGVSGLTSSESAQLSLVSTVQTLVDELHKINGLNSDSPMTVTPTGRTVDDIAQTFIATSNQTIVSRD